MENVIKLINERRSVRTFMEKDVPKEIIDKILEYAKNVKNPFDIPVDFAVFSEDECYLPTPAIVGANYYLCGKVKGGENSCVAYGYSFQETLLYAQSLGLGSVWLGAIVNRKECERLLNASEEEFTPCVSPLGYTQEKMSLREQLSRKTTNANSRIEFEKLFFEGSFDKPLTRENAGEYQALLEGVRKAPSAVNKQPWRVLFKENAFHFYLKRSRIIPRGTMLDMQRVDMGIALCHFSLVAKEKGLNLSFSMNAPLNVNAPNLEYVATYTIE